VPSVSVRIFISVAEESADLHAAALVKAARAAGHDWIFHGLTGPRLRALGVETVFDFASRAAMLGGVLGVLGHARRAIRAVEESWRTRRPDLVVLLDSPELHLRLARKAKQLRLPVLYYIAPQTWASREGRNRQIARDVDRLACILPFEEEYFRQHGVRAEYVGHPLFETLREERPIPDTVAFLKGRAAGRPIVALLPGSRQHVIDTMLPKQLEVVARLRAAGQRVYAAISCVSEDRRQQIRDLLATSVTPLPRREGLGEGQLSAPPLPAREGAGGGSEVAPASGTDIETDIIVADNASLLAAADLVLVASGTATLHVAYYRKPMIVMYDAGRLLSLPYRWFGRRVVKTPHLSLVNILAGARVVPEFMPFVPDLTPVAELTQQLLNDRTWPALMIAQLDELVRPLENSAASANVCRVAAGLLG
jgi:lipid-A-disaccharide synthase